MLLDKIAFVISAGASEWAFGWEALVAIGTLALALATGHLAWATKRTADAARDEQAGQWRPVIIPLDSGFWYSDDDGSVSVEVTLENQGRGPALCVHAALDGAGTSRRRWGVLAPGAKVRVDWSLDRSATGHEASGIRALAIDYDDLGQRTYSTRASIGQGTHVMTSAGRAQFGLDVGDIVVEPDSTALKPLG